MLRPLPVARGCSLCRLHCFFFFFVFLLLDAKARREKRRVEHEQKVIEELRAEVFERIRVAEEARAL